MKGKILDFNLQASEGVISGEDGNRYTFSTKEWKSTEVNPKNGLEVDFVGEDGVASGIYAQAKQENSVEQFVNSGNVFMRYYVGVIKDTYAKFDGRARREEYWFFTLFSIIISIILGAISAGALSLLYSLAVLLPTLALSVRRLHDTNRSGWWMLIGLIPLIGAIVLIIFFILDSQKEENQFGTSPKYN